MHPKPSSTLRFAARQALLSLRVALTELRLSMAKAIPARPPGPNVLDAMRRRNAKQRRVEELQAVREDLHAAIDVGRQAKSRPFYE